ncbi:DUF805 domain-containing protein [Agrococcus sp. ProA11]|uniref:DUF805 domain-containing protein n=1 Tax=Agrococcus chionoecetis TaxID=3153752 RepID=UPI0032611F0C
MSSSTIAPVGQPLHGTSFGQAVARFFRGYVQFSGRASRSEFWWAMLFTTLVSLAVQIPFWIIWAVFMTRVVASAATTGGNPTGVTGMPQDLAGIMGGMLLAGGVLVLVSLALTLPSLAVMWRRLQDANFHGAFALLSLVSLGIVPLILCFFESNPEGIRFDPRFAGRGLAGYEQPPQYPNPVALHYGEPAQAYAQQSYGEQPYPEPYGQQPYPEQPDGQPYDQPYSAPYGQSTEESTGDRPYSQGYPQS